MANPASKIIFKPLDISANEFTQLLSVAIAEDFTEEDFAKADGVIKAKVFLLNRIAQTNLVSN